MKNADKLKNLLHTLSDINRLRIIACLGAQESSVGKIVEATQMSQPLVSHHLKALKKNAIVDTRRKGPFIYYRLSSPQLLDVLGVLSDLAQNVEDDEPSPPMFQCPSWWRNLVDMKK